MQVVVAPPPCSLCSFSVGSGSAGSFLSGGERLFCCLNGTTTNIWISWGWKFEFLVAALNSGYSAWRQYVTFFHKLWWVLVMATRVHYLIPWGAGKHSFMCGS